jgi:hemolysin activation/secretion protein
MGMCLALVATGVAAQSPPDAGQLLQQTRPPLAPAPLTPPPVLNTLRPPQAAPSASSDARVSVDRFDFVGNSSISADLLRAQLGEFVGKALNFGELMQIVEKVETYYKAQGYFLAQGFLPPQKIRNGVIEITISEGRLGEVRLEGESRIAPDVVYAYLDPLPKDQPLTLPLLERQILLVNDLAGSQATLDLQAGEKNGSSDVVLVQKLDAPAGLRLDINNHGAASTGENRAALSLDLNSQLHQGERIALNAMSSDTQGLASYGVRTDWPIGAHGLRLLASLSRAQYSLGADFASLKASGTADALHLGASYPVVRSRSHNLRLQLDAETNQLRDAFQASNTVLDKTSNAFSLALDADWSDEASGSSTKAVATLKSGNLALGPAAQAQDASAGGLKTAGGFAKLNLTLQHARVLAQGWSASALLVAQVGNNNLDSSEKLSLGGPGSLPGYASGEGNADSGYQIKASLRRQFGDALALSAFADVADLQLNVSAPASVRNSKHLSDFGLALDWQYARRFTLSSQLAWAIDELQNPSDTRRPHVWVNAAFTW